MCPNGLVRLPPSSRIAAPASGNTSSSHADRWTPTAGRVVVAGAATACATARAAAGAATAAAASEPVTALPLYVPSVDPGRPRTPEGSILEQVRLVHRRGPASAEDR